MIEVNESYNLLRLLSHYVNDRHKTLCQCEEKETIIPQVLQQESDGVVLFTWSDIPNRKSLIKVTHVGCFDPRTQQSTILLVADNTPTVSTCSVNKERSLLAYTTVEHRPPDPSSRTIHNHRDVYKAFLVELQPQRRTFSLKLEREALIKVQFLYGTQSDKMAYMLVMLHKESIGLYSIPLSRVNKGTIICGQPSTERIVRRFNWCEWDGPNQRLYYIRTKRINTETLPRRVDHPGGGATSSFVCLQFHQQAKYDFMLEMPLHIEEPSIFASTNTVYDSTTFSASIPDSSLNITVLAHINGTLCICYQHPISSKLCYRTESSPGHVDQQYSVTMPHHAKVVRGCARVPAHLVHKTRTKLLFYWFYEYLAVCLPGCFVHLLNVNVEFEPVHSILLYNHDCLQTQKPATSFKSMSFDATIPIRPSKTPGIPPGNKLSRSSSMDTSFTMNDADACSIVSTWTTDDSFPPNMERIRFDADVKRSATTVAEPRRKNRYFKRDITSDDYKIADEGTLGELRGFHADGAIHPDKNADIRFTDVKGATKLSDSVINGGSEQGYIAVKEELMGQLDPDGGSEQGYIAVKEEFMGQLDPDVYGDVRQDEETNVEECHKVSEVVPDEADEASLMRIGANSPLVDIPSLGVAVEMAMIKEAVDVAESTEKESSLDLMRSDPGKNLGQWIVLTKGTNASGACLYNRRSGCVYKVELNSAAIVEHFKRDDEINARLALLHFVVRHCRDIALSTQLFSEVCKDHASLDVATLLSEFLIATTYGRMRKQLNKDIYRLLPFTSTDTFRGCIQKDADSGRLATITYESMKNIHMGTKSYIERGQWRNIEDMWDNLSRHLLRRQIETVSRFTQGHVRKRYKDLQLRDETKMGAIVAFSEQSEVSQAPTDMTTIDASTSVDATHSSLPLFLQEPNQDSCGQETLINLTESMLAHHIHQFNHKETQVKVINVAREYTKCQMQTARHCLHLLYVATSNSADDAHYNDSSYLLQPASESEHRVFHMLEKFVTATLDVAYPAPYCLQTFMTCLAYRTLPEHIFLQYIDRGVISFTDAFVNRFILEIPDRDDLVQTKLRIISRLSPTQTEECFRLWNHPLSMRRQVTGQVRNLLQNHAKYDIIESVKYKQIGRNRSKDTRSGFHPLDTLMDLIHSMDTPDDADKIVDLDNLRKYALYNHQKYMGTDVS